MNNKRTLQTVFIFALIAFMFALIVGMMYPFFSVILWTALLYILLNPLHKICLKKIDESKKFFQLKRHLLAGVFAIGVLLIIVVPLAAIGMVLVQQLLSFLKSAEAFITNNPDFFSESAITQFLSDLGQKLGLSFLSLEEIDIKTQLVKLIQQYSSKLISFASSVIAGTGNFLISLVFIDFALYFCFLDGRYLASLIAKAIPIDPDYMSTLMKKFTEITRHLFSGYILVALYQGIVAFVIMLIFGVKGALLLSVMLMLASFIPMFGTAIVWIPVGISICFTNSIVKGILFLIICGVCVSLLDNFLRPMFLKDRIKVHPLIIFFSILGGIKLFGMNGLLLGPIVIILFFTVLDMLNSSNVSEKKQQAFAENTEFNEVV